MESSCSGTWGAVLQTFTKQELKCTVEEEDEPEQSPAE